MSLNTKQKRGSVINVTIPGRTWIQVPQSQSTPHSRLSMIGLASVPDYAGMVSGLLFLYGRLGSSIGGFRIYLAKRTAKFTGSGIQ